MSDWIAVDWGTTALRATRMAGDRPGETRSSADGMSGLSPDAFEPRLLALVDDWLPAGAVTRVLVCGMAGARQGWHEAPYRAIPCAPLGDATAAVRARDPRLSVVIVPGLRQDRPHPDVMRGEETQLAGILAADPGFDGCACLPGTHTKWVHVSAGEVVSFRTAMTGETFALLAERSVLRHSLGDGDVWDGDAFSAAVSDALSRPETLTARLFQLRAADLLHGQDPAVARAVLSGLLIGAELAATKPWWMGRDVVICGSDRTGPVYDAALRTQGVAPRLRSADRMTLAGLTALWEQT